MIKHVSRIGTALLLLCLTVLCIASCDLTLPKYEITFVVEGEETVVTCREGKTPQFPGEVTRSSDSEYTYLFAGWDTALVPASANATYTARFVRYARDLVKITFVVDGNTQVAYFDKGKMPNYEQVLLPDEWSERYVVTDWDKPLAKVTGEETYTATAFTKTARETVRVTWTADTVYYMDVLFGALPKAPVVTEWDLPKYHNVFLRWNAEILPATDDVYYKAVVEKTVRKYDITFVVGDETETHAVPFGEMPEYSKGEPALGGNAALTSWDKQIVEVTCAATYTALPAAYEEFLSTETFVDYIENLADQRITYIAGENANGSGYFNTATWALMMALEENRCPGRFENALRDIAVANIKWILYSGCEHLMDASCFWSYPEVSGLFYVVRVTPTMWDALTDYDQERCDWMMKAYTCLTAFSTDDRNNYLTGPGLRGNYCKTWNPNYRLANVLPILNCLGYFGSASAVNNILATYDYDDYIAAFTRYGWENILSTWTAEKSGTLGGKAVSCNTKDLTMNGGQAYHSYKGYLENGGSGVGVRVPGGYQYMGYSLNNPGAIFNEVVSYTFLGGTVVDDSYGMTNGVITKQEYDKYLGTEREFDASLIGQPKMIVLRDVGDPENPVLGLEGMMTEFISGDAYGFRSSGSYCADDFNMITSMLLINKIAGWWNPADYTDTASRMYVGMTDLAYKLEIGCYGYSLGMRYLCGEQAYGGYFYTKEAWRTLLADDCKIYALGDD